MATTPIRYCHEKLIQRSLITRHAAWYHRRNGLLMRRLNKRGYLCLHCRLARTLFKSFFNPSEVDFLVIDSLPQYDIIHLVDLISSIDKVHIALKQINSRKSSGLDGILVELLQHGGENILSSIHNMSTLSWKGTPIPQDWVDGILVSIFKGKGSKSECDHYRGITLLEAVDKCWPGCCWIGWWKISALRLSLKLNVVSDQEEGQPIWFSLLVRFRKNAFSNRSHCIKTLLILQRPLTP